MPQSNQRRGRSLRSGKKRRYNIGRRKRYVESTGHRYRRKHKSPSKMRWVPMPVRWAEQDLLDAQRAKERAS